MKINLDLGKFPTELAAFWSSKQMDMGKMLLSIHLDLSEVLDTLDHNILLSKLDHYGITGLANSLFKSSSLVRRNKYVYFNDTESDRE